MNINQNFKHKLTLQFLSLALISMVTFQSIAAPLALSSVPLFLTSNGKPNLLLMMGNSNSMDSDASGLAVGSSAITSKSEIARNTLKSVIANNAGVVNVGLLAYQQDPSSRWFLMHGAYDVSFNPIDYNPAYTGPRNGTTKKFRYPNSTSPGNFVYYNIDLPSHYISNLGTAFCYSQTACTDPNHDFYGIAPSCTEHESVANGPWYLNGPWDLYSCWASKTGTSNVIPADDQHANAQGYFNKIWYNYEYAGDQDIAQGILDFGKILTWETTGMAWYANTAPGKGYLHIPLSLLNTDQIAALNKKLATSKPTTDSNSPIDVSKPLQNSGLSALEGTVLTANNYFNGVALPADQGGPAAAIPNSCGKNFLVLLTDGLPSVSKTGTASANVVQNLADLTTQVTDLKNSAATVKTYMVGFALPYGVNPSQLDTIAAAGGTGTSYYAKDTASLNTALSSIFSNIAAQTASASAVALNSSSVNTNSRVYQAKFSSQDWSGQLLSIAVNASNGTLGAMTFDAGQQINTQAATNRNILTYKPSTNTGIPFRWPATPASPTASELDLVQTAFLNTSATNIADSNGSARLDYLRGSSVNEGTAGLQFRARNTSKLGDIVDSAPQYVGAPSLNLADPTYAAFRLSQQSRTPIIYVGANDGMLHGFNASTGNEAIAYVPSSVYSNLTLLTSTGYAHRYYVDGSPTAADIFYGGAWHTTLIGTMGNGAKGIFSLDITNPGNFTEANAANLVNFEFPNSTTIAADAEDVGYVSGPVPIVKLNNGVWAAIFGNGYNSTGTGQSSLFIVDVKTGALIKKISTGVGSTVTPNALANPIAIDTDGNNTADVVYAGDLQGNMWKFDISSASPGAWGVSYKLFSAGQPITETPSVSKNPDGGLMVYFGTGQYLETADITTATSNAFYGIWDNFGTTVPLSGLVQQTVTGTVAASGTTYRQVSQNTVNYKATPLPQGWYINLPTSGERSVNDSRVRAGHVIFTTTIPSTAACTFGGSSTTMVVDYLTGGMPSTASIDTNKDGAVNASDILVGGIVNSSINSDPTIMSGTKSSGVDYGITTNTNGTTTEATLKKSDVVSRRTSWRQIPLQ